MRTCGWSWSTAGTESVGTARRYPFVRLHQASSFYGVASTLLGDGLLQRDGPEAGLHKRASAPEVCAYYDRVLHERLLPSGNVAFYPNCDYLGEGRFVSRVSGRPYQVRGSRRIVDARYLSPSIPATTAAPYAVADGVHAIAVNDLAALEAAPSEYVIVGSGKTATDACIWLLDNGVDPGAICWVRPREPWMLNRAVVQPDPLTFLGTAGDIMEAAASATRPRTTCSSSWKTRGSCCGSTHQSRPRWPRCRRSPDGSSTGCGRLTASSGSVTSARGTGPVGARRGRSRHRPRRRRRALRRSRPEVPAAGADLDPRSDHIAAHPDHLRLLGAALAGYVEATLEDDAEKNRLCPPVASNTPVDWARQQVLGSRASSFTSYPTIRDWADGVSLNPGRIPPDLAGSAAVAAQERVAQYIEPGLARLTELAGMA